MYGNLRVYSYFTSKNIDNLKPMIYDTFGTSGMFSINSNGGNRMKRNTRVGLVTSGGDCQGLNA